MKRASDESRNPEVGLAGFMAANLDPFSPCTRRHLGQQLPVRINLAIIIGRILADDPLTWRQLNHHSTHYSRYSCPPGLSNPTPRRSRRSGSQPGSCHASPGVQPGFIGISISLLIRARDISLGLLGLWLGAVLTRKSPSADHETEQGETIPGATGSYPFQPLKEV